MLMIRYSASTWEQGLNVHATVQGAQLGAIYGCEANWMSRLDSAISKA